MSAPPAMPEWSAIHPACRPITSTTITRSWDSAVVCRRSIASVAIENLKGYVISPVVEGDQLDIHPLVVFISVLVGSALLGVAGAFVAVPAAAMLAVLYEEVVRPWRTAQLARAD